MTLNDLVQNWDGVTPKRKIEALQNLVDFFKYEDGDPENEDVLLYEIFENASNYEDDDFFGTEGLEV